MTRVVIYLFLVGFTQCRLWKKGIVHYSINNKDYDTHSQDVIQTTLSEIQKELCVKFFNTYLNRNDTHQKILHISNPEKRKDCTPIIYDFNKTVIDMPIGYKCLDRKNIVNIIVDMLRASIDDNTPVNSNDLNSKFKEKENVLSTSLVPSTDRNYINSHYHEECGALSQPVPQRRANVKMSISKSGISKANYEYYKDKVWPLGIVLYGIGENLKHTVDYGKLLDAMVIIQRETCIVFEEVVDVRVLIPNSVVWFDTHGDDMPRFGFVPGNQTISLHSMMNGTPGHKTHALNNLMRILGVHMMSNRYDRDNYVFINWRNVQPGKEQYLEKAPEEAWLPVHYDFDSVTHAPPHYMCYNCDYGETTVYPVQDTNWRRLMSLGRNQALTETDVKTLDLLYSKQCKRRYITESYEYYVD